MKEGQASRTAELVCVGRAMAHGRGEVPAFSDPTALTLLSEKSRRRVEDAVHNRPPRGPRERMLRTYLNRASEVMLVRTVGIDDEVRAAHTPQVVILGAGLDGRAWRMSELAGAVVFEVDHPDSQRVKRARAESLHREAKEVRFVPVDFTRDRLADALEAAGHDPRTPTTWIWEGVVMYLTQAEIEATLEVVRARSAPKSELLVLYIFPRSYQWLMRPILKVMGEPFKSTFKPAAMRELLAKFGFAVKFDENLPELAVRLAPSLATKLKRITHLRLVAAMSS